ncbi:MAG: hypothetical protein Q8Q08_07935 [Candidatus Omnitrophota bacterium]|nr:hypothetical protein [Candidatus Omnitrophota bacterium]MDZ4243101.1 hypothetical protein [Candidatus Omnitrophota bacterium]
MPSQRIPKEKKDLVRRYLLWCYKTTREDLERVDRKFTQLEADRRILTHLDKNKTGLAGEVAAKYRFKVEQFVKYIEDKEKGAVAQKFSDSARRSLQPEYLYLKNRFAAIEKTVVDLLGKGELRKMQELFEREFTRRILEARDHT